MSLTRRQALAFAPAALLTASGAARAASDPRWADDPRLAQLWRCVYPDCPGYVYDPLVGEAKVGVAAGTAFEDLDEDFWCPECGNGTDVFVRDVDRADI